MWGRGVAQLECLPNKNAALRKPGVVAHAGNPGTQAKAAGSIQGHPPVPGMFKDGLQQRKILSQTQMVN